MYIDCIKDIMCLLLGYNLGYIQGELRVDVEDIGSSQIFLRFLFNFNVFYLYF